MAKPPLKLVQRDDDPQPVRIPPSAPAEADSPPEEAPEPEELEKDAIPPVPPTVKAKKRPHPEPEPEDKLEHEDDPDVETDLDDADDPEPSANLSITDNPASRPVLAVDQAPKPATGIPLQVEEREPEILNVPDKEPEPAPAQKSMRVRKRAVRPRRHSKRKARPSGRVVVHRTPMPQPERLAERYEILSTLGTGGTGTVYHALDQLLETEVAIKVLAEDLVQNDALMQTLKHEARMAMQLSNTHIVRLHNLESIGNSLALVMEFVDGETLGEVIGKTGAFDLETVSQILASCDRAISHAHRHHVLHADLNPANMMLSRDGVLKIIDFGEACIPSTEIEEGEWVAGTPPYMAPEQKAGKSVDVRADVYGLGITTYQLLTCQLPYPAGTTLNEMLEIMPTGLPQLEDPIRSVVEAAIAPDPDERWQTVHDFAVAFAQTVT